LAVHYRSLCDRYPLDRGEIAGWWVKVLALFPVYAKHWQAHPDVKERTPLLQERVFDVPYRLPSGRMVRLRGKWDSVDLIGSSIYLQENKTKSAIDAEKVGRQLRFDLQTMLYLVALGESDLAAVTEPAGLQVRLPGPIRGVRYNVVRRSSHKTAESMMEKVLLDQRQGRIQEWFARWKVEITPADVDTFRRQCLDPVLENVCWWWDERLHGLGIKGGARDLYEPPPSHWRHPFGVYNVLDEGGSSELDSCLESGSEAGLQRTDDLFPELKG
jgi:hypothetical protein